MNKTVKKITGITLSVAMLFTGTCMFTACGSGETASSDESVEKENAVAAMSAADDLEKFIKKADKDFAWDITETLSYDEKYWDSKSGFRTGGSDAEHKAADYIAGVFEEIGLEDVQKEPFSLDKWQFNGSEFALENEAADVSLKLEPVSYASTGTGAEGITGEVVYLGHGYESDYNKYYDKNNLTGDDRNMNGKIVLIDINQDEEFWIDSHYQEAYFQGASALMSYSSQYVDKNGKQRGDKWDEARQMQDLCSRNLEVPCVSISRKDGLDIRASIKQIKQANETPVATLKVDNEIAEDAGQSYNVTGKIKGTGNTGQQILVAGHYDKFFYGTNDDCAAIGIISSMAKAMIDSGYKPVNDIIFIAHGAEEWGQTGTAADWAVGSWNMITKMHPEWQGTTLGILNYELPAKKGQGEGLSGVIISSEETYAIQNGFIKDSGLVDVIGEDADITQMAMSQVISDAICYQFNGVPFFQINGHAGKADSKLNTYHTQYDNKDDYSAKAMDYALKLSGALAMYIDQSPALVLGFGKRCNELEGAIKKDKAVYKEAGVNLKDYRNALEAFRASGKAYTDKAKALNAQYEEAVKAGEDTSAIVEEALSLNQQGLKAYKYMQDTFLGMGGDGEVYIYHDIIRKNISVLDDIIKNLKDGDVGAMMESAWMINGGLEYNAYSFSEDTCEEILKVAFCDYETDNRLYGKTVGRAETYEATHAIATRAASEGFKEEIAIYKGERSKLIDELAEYFNQEVKGMNEMSRMLAVD